MNLIVIQQKIYEVRGQKIMLDKDLAEIYGVETRVLKQAVNRNMDRFPKDFMFRLNNKEVQEMVSHFVIPSKSYFGGSLPYAFTEHGVTMLASVLRSKKAVKMNIAIVRAFIALRQVVIHNKEIFEQLKEVRERIGEHDVQLNQIYDTIENLLDDKEEKKTWEDRERIGFKKTGKQK